MLNTSKISLAAIVCASTSLVTPAYAQYTTQWEGDVDTNMNTPGNWNNGDIGREAAAVFDDPSAVTFQPDIPTGAPNNRAEVNSLTFNQAGWNITTDGTTHVVFWNQGGTPFLTSNGAGTNTIGGIRTANPIDTVTTGAGNTLEIGYSNGALTMATKAGDGTFVLGSGVALNNLPDVNAGTLIYNGSSTWNDSNDRTIASGSVLGGNGGIGHFRQTVNYNFVSTATLAPGEQGLLDSSAGTLSFFTTPGSGPTPHVNVNLLTGSSLAIDIFADGSSDKLSFGGTKASSDTMLNISTGVSLDLFGTAAATTYTIAEFTDAGEYTSGNGTFSTITLNGVELTEGVDYTVAYNEHIAFDPGSGSIEVTLVPEPQTYALVAGGLILGLAILRRRR